MAKKQLPPLDKPMFFTKERLAQELCVCKREIDSMDVKGILPPRADYCRHVRFSRLDMELWDKWGRPPRNDFITMKQNEFITKKGAKNDSK